MPFLQLNLKDNYELRKQKNDFVSLHLETEDDRHFERLGELVLDRVAALERLLQLARVKPLRR